MSVFEELRFGPDRTLNLRESLPARAEAVRRAENFLREHQVRGSEEVLVITGRGRQSFEGVAVIREAVEKLLFSLKRQGVVAWHEPWNPGAFVVRLAPVRSLVDAIPRNKDRRSRPSLSAVEGLSDETNALLRAVAERSLAELGVVENDLTVREEIHRHLRALAPSLPGGARMEPALQTALRAALASYD